MTPSLLFNPISALSLKQLLSLWGELVEAYHGVHGYGSDTAEIYAYRFQSYSPMAHTHNDEDAKRGCANSAAAALVALCVGFEGDHDCRITIDGMAPLSWLEMSQNGGTPFNDRAYVKVKPTSEG